MTGQRFLLALLAFFGVASYATAQDAAAPDAKHPTREGRLVRIPLPLESGDEARIRSLIERTIEPLSQQTPRHVLVLEFTIRPNSEPEKAEEYAQGSKFLVAYELARYISQLSKVQKIAYVPKSATGHAVLVAMACDEIFMAPDASIGKAGVIEDAVTNVHRAGYKEIFDLRKTIPSAIVFGMLDKDQIVYRVETDAGREFVLGVDLAEFRKTRLVKGEPTILIERGQFGLFKGSEARGLGFVKFLARGREHLATELELPADGLVEDPSLGGEWTALQITITGPINDDIVGRWRSVQDEISRREANLVVLRIESAGGSPEHSINLAQYIAELNPSEVRTIAYIAKEARGDAALVALACDHVVMTPGAVLGGKGDFETDETTLDLVTQSVQRSLAPAKNRSWSLPAALVDPTLEIHRYTRQGDRNTLVEYFTKKEADDRKEQDGEWQRGEVIKPAGEPFSVTAAQAKEYRLATHVVEDFAGMKDVYHLKDDPIEVQPNWAHRLIKALAQPSLAWLLIAIGFGAMYIELHTPGVGVAGFISGLCFLLFFWGQYLNATAEWLEVLLFVGGVLCVMLELFIIPGFGVIGFGGGVMILTSLVLASQTFVWPKNDYEIHEMGDSLFVVGLGIGGCIAMAVALRSYLPRTPFFGRVLLQPLAGQALADLQQRESIVDLTFLVGQLGVATTPLTPAGIARFEDEVIHVVSQGDFIPKGADVVVIEAHGNRVVVRAAEKA